MKLEVVSKPESVMVTALDVSWQDNTQAIIISRSASLEEALYQICGLLRSPIPFHVPAYAVKPATCGICDNGKKTK